MKEKNKVLIIGANGFIGYNLGRVIKAKYPNWQVYEADRQPNSSGKFYQLDIKCENKLRQLLLKIKPRYIFHLAGSISARNFKDLFLSHVYSSFCLFKTVKEIEGYNPRIIVPSSAAEYGSAFNSKIAATEECALAPASLYGFSKMTQTNLSLFFARQGMDIVVARIFNITGEGTPNSFSIGRFAYELVQMRKKRKARYLCIGNLDTKRDFLDIHDVCAYLTALAINGIRGQIYNVCRGKSYSVRLLLNKMINISGLHDVVIKEDTECGNQRNQADSFGSAKKIRDIARIKLTPIEKSLEATYKYYLGGG